MKHIVNQLYKIYFTHFRKKISFQLFYFISMLLIYFFFCIIKAYASKANLPLQYYANKILNESVSDKVNRYGTFRISSNINEDFSLSNIGLDLLLPFQDKGPLLYFWQTNYSQFNEDRLFNFGLGRRYFSAQSMLGLNIFFDYNLDNDHYRIGSGIEYWQNYLNLALNSYWALSLWAPDKINNYETKPANGLDIDLKAYLPYHPQLGAFIRYEKYFGFINDPLSTDFLKDQDFLKFGFNYSFFPLLTLGAHYTKLNQKSINLNVKAELTYRLWMPLKEQLNSENIDKLRRLSGARYEFVSRNKNIILQYHSTKKTENNDDSKPIIFKLHNPIKGIGNSKIPIIKNTNIDSNYKICWDGDKILVKNLSPQCYKPTKLAKCCITLPPYNNAKNNQYKLSAILKSAHDTEEIIKTQTRTVTILNEPEKKFKLWTDNANLILNSLDETKQTSTILLTVSDENRNKLANLEKDLTLLIFYKGKKFTSLPFHSINNEKTVYYQKFNLQELQINENGIYNLKVKYKNKVIKDTALKIHVKKASALEDKKLTLYSAKKILVFNSPLLVENSTEVQLYIDKNNAATQKKFYDNLKLGIYYNNEKVKTTAPFTPIDKKIYKTTFDIEGLDHNNVGTYTLKLMHNDELFQDVKLEIRIDNQCFYPKEVHMNLPDYLNINKEQSSIQIPFSILNGDGKPMNFHLEEWRIQLRDSSENVTQTGGNINFLIQSDGTQQGLFKLTPKKAGTYFVKLFNQPNTETDWQEIYSQRITFKSQF